MRTRPGQPNGTGEERCPSSATSSANTSSAGSRTSRSPTAIQRDVRERFGIALGFSAIRYYDPTRVPTPKKRWAPIFHAARKERTADQAELTGEARQIARLARRIVEVLEGRVLDGFDAAHAVAITDEDRLRALKVFVARLAVGDPAGLAEIRRALERDDFLEFVIPLQVFVLRMIFSENRYPSSIEVEDMLFGIMRWTHPGRTARRRPRRGSHPARHAMPRKGCGARAALAKAAPGARRGFDAAFRREMAKRPGSPTRATGRRSRPSNSKADLLLYGGAAGSSKSRPDHRSGAPGAPARGDLPPLLWRPRHLLEGEDARGPSARSSENDWPAHA